MIRTLVLTIFLCLTGVPILADGMPQTGKPVKEINAKDTANLLKNPNGEIIIVDVRTPGEFAEGHIPGAKNIDLFGVKFEGEILKLPKDKQIILYCRTGKRSQAAAEILQNAGYENSVNMIDGMEGWNAGKYKVEKSGTSE